MAVPETFTWSATSDGGGGMSAILVKIFATALTLSQVLVDPESVRTTFDPAPDQEKVSQILKEGCTHMRRAFDIEDINLDDLIVTAMDDPQAVTGELKMLQGLSFNDLHASYRQFCKNEKVEPSPVNLGEVIAYYNGAVAELPDARQVERPEAARASASSSMPRASASRKCSSRIIGASGSLCPTFRKPCSRLSSRPRTSGSISITASTSAA